MSKIDEMFKDNEKIIIDTLKQIRNSLYVEENFYEWQVAIDKIIDLYNKEKLNRLSLSEQLNKEKEKNKALKEGLKYRINYCKLLEKELYVNGVNYEFEKTEIEKQFLEE